VKEFSLTTADEMAEVGLKKTEEFGKPNPSRSIGQADYFLPILKSTPNLNLEKIFLLMGRTSEIYNFRYLRLKGGDAYDIKKNAQKN